ncbi:Hemin import ATP-binding protein HmuV [compost metagenome]
MGALSGGEQQRVRLAQALAQEPAVLLLDEPTAWADLRFQLDLLKRVSELARTKGIAVVAVLHDLNHAAQFCSRLLLLHHGRLAADGTPHETLTPTAILEAFGVPVLVQRHPETLAPFILPRLGEV